MMMNIHGKGVVVVGGGNVARRKVAALLEHGALITVVSPALDPALANLADQARITAIRRPFNDEDLDGYPRPVLVFGATGDNEVNVKVYRAATERNIPCNIVDVPALCTFIVPAVVRRGDFAIAVTTGGASPALARRVREDLEKSYGPEYAAMTTLLARLREIALQDGASSNEHAKLFFDVVDSGLLHALKQGDIQGAKSVLRSLLPASIDVDALVEGLFQD
jgi:precorrin-2 dehydrogenase/sirohydrochlorin ferrochelatase